MKKLEIETFASWAATLSIFGVHHSPLTLLVRAHNTTNSTVPITGICVSIKTSYILFTTSKDISYRRTSARIPPRNRLEFEVDVRPILAVYGANKKFTVKIFSGDKYYESGKLTVQQLHDLVSRKVI